MWGRSSVEPRRTLAARVSNPGSQGLDAVTQAPQHLGQPAVVLEAVAAAPAHHQLCVEVTELELDRLTRQHRQVFEGDGAQVCALDATQQLDAAALEGLEPEAPRVVLRPGLH